MSSTVATRITQQFGPRPPQGLAGTGLGPLVDNLEQLRMVGAKEDEQLARVASALPKATLWRVPFLSREVCDLPALTEVATFLGNHEPPGSLGG